MILSCFLACVVTFPSCFGWLFRLAVRNLIALKSKLQCLWYETPGHELFRRRPRLSDRCFPPRGPKAAAWHSHVRQVAHWREELAKAQSQRDALRDALEEKDRELQEERRRNAELMARSGATRRPVLRGSRSAEPAEADKDTQAGAEGS